MKPLTAERSKDRARKLAQRAVMAGVLIRPLLCTRCFSPRRIEGHHPDYRLPLHVIWLCAHCHRNEHRGPRAKRSSSITPSAAMPLLTIDDVAALLAVSASDVLAAVAGGSLPAYRISRQKKRGLRFRPDEVKRFSQQAASA